MRKTGKPVLQLPDSPSASLSTVSSRERVSPSVTREGLALDCWAERVGVLPGGAGGGGGWGSGGVSGLENQGVCQRAAWGVCSSAPENL